MTRFVLIALIAVTVNSIPYTASAQTNTKPQVLEIKNVPYIPDIATIHQFLTNTDEVATPEITIDPITINAPILKEYLEKKGSPLAPYAEHILKHENWKLVLAISNGESTMCKHQLYHNCWGVGGAWNMRHYSDFGEGFSDVNRFLTEKYVAKGADTPAKIVNKYVGHPNANWVLAVNNVLTDLDKLPLVE